MIQEVTLFSAATGSAVDKAEGILRGVSVITEGDCKGHGLIADATTLEQVKACAETYTDGLRVKMDHGTGIDAMVGVLKGFRIDGKQLRSDLYLIKSHEDFEKICEMAETMPGSFGLSISFSGSPEMVTLGPIPSGMPVDDETDSDEECDNSGTLPNTAWAARCTEIYSADIVDMPAANPSGLFSTKLMSEQTETPEVPTETPVVKVEEVVTETPSAPVEEVKEELNSVTESEVATPEAPVTEIPASELPADAIAEIAKSFDVAPEEIESVGIVDEEKAPEVAPLSEIIEDVNTFAARQDEFTAKVTTLETELSSKETFITELSSKLAEKEREIISLRAQVEEASSKQSKLSELHQSLKRSLGLLPASNVPETALIPEVKSAATYRAEYAAIKDPVARADYFKKNESHLYGA